MDSGKAAERRYRRRIRSPRGGRTIAARIKRALEHRISMQTVGKVLVEERDKLRAEFRCELERRR